MSADDLQSLCAVGQSQLIEMDYLAAERTLVRAERLALDTHDFDALSRLYMPLQEARRQRRQRCGEGTVHLSIAAESPDDALDPEALIDRYPHGQLLIAGWGSLEPAIRFRQLQAERSLYVETFLAAVYPVNGQRAIVIVPLADSLLPPPVDRPIDLLLPQLPLHSIVMPFDALSADPQIGTPQTYAYTMDLWERLHQPFLSFAEPMPDGMAKIDAFKRTIEVDYACEFAHQHLAQTANRLYRRN